ncbi:MAG: hypothetical protein ACI4J5_03600 [Oscillospiraceae bacterium]
MSEKRSAAGKTSPWVYVEFIVIGILILLIAAMLVIYFSFRETGSAPKIFGYYIYQTHAVNMEPKIPAESAVFAKADEKENIGEDSVVLCRLDNNLAIIRVVEMLEEDGEEFYIVRYDTSPVNDTYKIPAESVIAKAMYYDKFTGSLLNFATSEKGIIIVVIIPSILIVLFQVVKLVLAQKDSDDGDEDEGLFGKPIPTGDNVMSEKSSEEPVYRELAPVKAKFDTSAPEKQQSSFKIDRSGAAVYEPAVKAEDILITGERLDEMSGRKPKESFSAADSFSNETVKIPEEKKAEKSLFDELMNGSAESGSDMSQNISNVIPDRIAQIRTLASPADAPEEAAGRRSRWAAKSEEVAAAASAASTPREFFSMEPEKVIPPDETDEPILKTDSVPKDSVVPKEKIAPKRKQNANKTIEELMGIIDEQQAKISKMK